MMNDIAQMIDHAILQPYYTERDVEIGCELAQKYEVYSVCVRPCDVSLSERLLCGSGVSVTTVVGFPHGSNTHSIKEHEAIQAMNGGAVEIDMVMNIGYLRHGKLVDFQREISWMVRVAHDLEAMIKIILETCYLSEKELKTACVICKESGVDFIKTSTGFGPRGVSNNDIRLIKQYAHGVPIKASGGIQTLARVLELQELGCSRIGTSHTKKILDELCTT